METGGSRLSAPEKISFWLSAISPTSRRFALIFEKISEIARFGRSTIIRPIDIDIPRNVLFRKTGEIRFF